MGKEWDLPAENIGVCTWGSIWGRDAMGSVNPCDCLASGLPRLLVCSAASTGGVNYRANQTWEAVKHWPGENESNCQTLYAVEISEACGSS